MAPAFLSACEACALLGVTTKTLARWADQGKVKCIRPNKNGHRRYDVTSFKTAREQAESNGAEDESAEEENRPTVTVNAIYARVSTRKQAGDLQRQVSALKAKYPDHVVITDIASGLNFNRKGLKALLQLCFEGRLQKVRVAHKDRLCRFAFDLLKHVLQEHGAEITVEEHDENASSERDLADDVLAVLAVITVFGARLHGRRSKGKKRKAVLTDGADGEAAQARQKKHAPDLA